MLRVDFNICVCDFEKKQKLGSKNNNRNVYSHDQVFIEGGKIVRRLSFDFKRERELIFSIELTYF